MPTRRGRRLPAPRSRIPLERRYALAIKRSAVEPAIRAVKQFVLPVLKAIDADKIERMDEDPREKARRAVHNAENSAALKTSQGDIQGAAQVAMRATHRFQVEQLELQVGHTVEPDSKKSRKAGQKAIIRLGADPFGREPWLARKMVGAVRDNVSLIRSIPKRHFREIREIVDEGVKSGSQASVIAKRIEQRFGVARRRAELIAADQVGKFHSSLDQIRMNALGIEEYIWRTSLDERVREEHRIRDGKTFKMDDPPEDGHPGEAVRCRCYREPILPDVEQTTTGVELETPPPQPPPEDEPSLFEVLPPLLPPPAPPPAEITDDDEADGTPLAQHEIFKPKAYAASRKEITPTGAVTTPGDVAALMTKLAAGDASVATEARRAINEIIHKYKLVSRDVSLNTPRAGDLEIKNQPGAVAFHGFDGRMGISPHEIANFQSQNELTRHDAFSSLVHEALHGASPASWQAYYRTGRVVEEVTTEVAARKITRDQTGNQYFNPSANLAYQGWIREVAQAVDEAVGVGGGLTRDQQVNGILEKASFIYKRGAGVEVTDEVDVADRFAAAIIEAAGAEPGLKMTVLKKLREATNRLQASGVKLD